MKLDPAQWVDEYGDYLFRYAFSRLREPNASEEVVQETFLAGIRYHDQFAGRGSERAWLLGILKRKIIDHVRKRMKHERAGTFADDADPSNQFFDENGRWKDGTSAWNVGPESGVEARELWDVVRGCLQHLPAGQADVFTLSVMEEMDTETICNELGITPANLWVRLHRARLSLAKCVGNKWFHQANDSRREPRHVE